jgi:hypothetical protein
MLGFSPTQSSLEILQHYEHLKEVSDDTHHTELDCIYKWVSDSNFLSAMDKNTVQSWKYLKNILETPPTMIIEEKANSARNMDILSPHVFRVPTPKAPTCNMCHETLCDTITEKAKGITKVICKCDTMWLHTKCVQHYTNKSSQCNVCKEYFIVSPLQTSLRSSLVDWM